MGNFGDEIRFIGAGSLKVKDLICRIHEVAARDPAAKNVE
ncbi:hypothetical protein O23A_p3632 [Aeromonas salmonicida]|nr:hypothetical protein O23A_p3632 [Aeromonas salmonicida]